MIARGGRGLVAVSAIAALGLFLVTASPLALLLLVLTGFLVFVFRDPTREVGQGIVAPADGVVRDVDPALGMVSTYLALRNVHVTRAPFEGIVERLVHTPGGHSPAFSNKTRENETVEISVRTMIGEVKVRQMTGALARRIVPYVGLGQTVAKGDKLGLIRFGSRVDLYLPVEKIRILVRRGDRLRAGVTMIAEVSDGLME